MTQPKTENHAIARDLVASGDWHVDPDSGHVLGKKGQPFRRMNTDGYIQIKFRDPVDWRRERSVLAHRVIWETEHGPLDHGLTINHRNGVKTDNRLANLEAVTQAENMRHAYATGLNRVRLGTEIATSLLTDDQAREIYRRAWLNEPQQDIAVDMGISREVVSNIKRGWSWSHVTGHAAGRASAHRYAA